MKPFEFIKTFFAIIGIISFILTFIVAGYLFGSANVGGISTGILVTIFAVKRIFFKEHSKKRGQA